MMHKLMQRHAAKRVADQTYAMYTWRANGQQTTQRRTAKRIADQTYAMYTWRATATR